jgi:hypothetical protein
MSEYERGRSDALTEAADWLESEAATFTVGRVADEGLYDAATKAVGDVLEALAKALRRRSKRGAPTREDQK